MSIQLWAQFVVNCVFRVLDRSVADPDPSGSKLIGWILFRLDNSNPHSDQGPTFNFDIKSS